jgi:1,4-dihydroxy-2-naphthoate octaprenyltransferase
LELRIGGLAMGVASILAALAIPGGRSFGYYGLGTFVFIFSACCHLRHLFVQAGSVSRLAVWAAIPMGLLITGILVVNNLRDISKRIKRQEKDAGGTPGSKNTQIEYLLCLVISI